MRALRTSERSERAGEFSAARGGPRGAPARSGGRRLFRGLLLAAVTAWLAPGAVHADIYAGFSQPAINVPAGTTFTVYVVIQQAGGSFNAFDASIRFDPAMLTFVPTSPTADQRGDLMVNACSNTFHRFTPASDSLKITLSLLCSGVAVTGPGTVYQVQFQAGTTQGTTTIRLGPFTEFYRAGLFVRPLHTQELTVTVGGSTGVDPLPGSAGGLMLAPPVPNPRRGEGAVVFEFELPGPDVVRLDVLDLAGRQVAGREAEAFGAGRQRLEWAPPRLKSGEYFVRLRTGSGGAVTRRWVTLE